MSVATSGMERSREGGHQIGDAVLIAGPTASGKSALALEIAKQRNGVIVNADSMQVYSVLNVLTARPGPDDLAAAPHFLYGHVHPSRAYSTGEWLRDVERLVSDGALAGCTAIFVGGTGLYFRALLGGLSEMPRIPPEIRERWRAALAAEGPAALHDELERRDPAAAAKISPSDRQRLPRALEVLEASGRSILEFREARGRALVDPQTAERYVIEPDRAALHARINARFDQMIAEGALEEVKALGTLNPALPAMKAIGVRELQAARAGHMPVEQAIEKAKAATRQYAKRQTTWFRHQLDERWRRIPGPG